MNNTNAAEKTLSWVNARLAEGRTVFFSTSLKKIKVTNKAIANWEAKGHKLLSISKDGLRVGKDLVATPTTILVKVSAI